jgi:hypothetical protein
VEIFAANWKVPFDEEGKKILSNLGIGRLGIRKVRCSHKCGPEFQFQIWLHLAVLSTLQLDLRQTATHCMMYQVYGSVPKFNKNS